MRIVGILTSATNSTLRGYSFMTRISRAGWTATIFAGALAASLAFAPNSFAARRHVHLEKSTPADKEVLATSPKTISLWFSEKVDLKVTTVKLVDDKGVAAALGALKADTTKGAPVIADVTKPLAAGSYTLNWSVAGADGHPQKGAFKFSVKAAH
jgi:methionine-rich copper-binding protein CopC